MPSTAPVRKRPVNLTLNVNGRDSPITVQSTNMPLLWALRDGLDTMTAGVDRLRRQRDRAVVLRPTGEGVVTLAGLAVLVSASAYSLSSILVRVLHRTDSGQSMVFWMLLMTGTGAAALAWPNWQPLQMGDAWVIAGVGLSGFLGQVAITEAFRSGEASVVAPFEYSALAWGLGLDLMIWGVLPDGWTFFGAGIIVASGLYIVHRERVRSAG